MLKHFIKKIIEQVYYLLFSKNYKDIIKSLDNYSIISFDIFDTLVKRVVKSPKDIFDLVEMEYNKYNEVCISNFKINRINAEKKAFKYSSFEEVTLEEIYSYMNKFDGVQKKKLLNIEKKIELDLCKQNHYMYEIYLKCIADKKTIFITSDMYLPKDIIEEILKKNGYTYYNKLYLSSEQKITKRTGKLYETILNDNSVNKKEMLHIGDSIIQDYVAPRKKGIYSILINRNEEYAYFCNSKTKERDYAMLRALMNQSNYKIANTSYYSLFGYEVFGPILYGFVSWLHAQLKANNIQKVYFLARDAKIIMNAYKYLYGEDIWMSYINISRKSIILSDLKEIHSFGELYNRLKSIIKNTANIEDFFNLLNLDISNYSEKLKLENISLHSYLRDLSDKEKDIIFSMTKEKIIENSIEQEELLKKYLEQEKMNGDVAFVDIGWRGTIQFLVTKKIKNINIYGYYFGINMDKNFNEYNFLNRTGYLFDNTKISNYQSIISVSVGVFESMFLSTEGTTLGYQIQGESVKPILDKKNLISGPIEEIQLAVMKFVETIKENNLELYFNNFKNTIYFENYKEFVCHPTMESVQNFKNFEFQGHNKKKLISNRSFCYYLFHMRKLFIDLNNSYCKILFLKNVFKVKLPYYKILNYFYKKTKI